MTNTEHKRLGFMIHTSVDGGVSLFEKGVMLQCERASYYFSQIHLTQYSKIELVVFSCNRVVIPNYG